MQHCAFLLAVGSLPPPHTAHTAHTHTHTHTMSAAQQGQSAMVGFAGVEAARTAVTRAFQFSTFHTIEDMYHMQVLPCHTPSERLTRSNVICIRALPAAGQMRVVPQRGAGTSVGSSGAPLGSQQGETIAPAPPLLLLMHRVEERGVGGGRRPHTSISPALVAESGGGQGGL